MTACHDTPPFLARPPPATSVRIATDLLTTRTHVFDTSKSISTSCCPCRLRRTIPSRPPDLCRPTSTGNLLEDPDRPPPPTFVRTAAGLPREPPRRPRRAVDLRDRPPRGLRPAPTANLRDNPDARPTLVTDRPPQGPRPTSADLREDRDRYLPLDLLNTETHGHAFDFSKSIELCLRRHRRH